MTTLEIAAAAARARPDACSPRPWRASWSAIAAAVMSAGAGVDLELTAAAMSRGWRDRSSAAAAR